MKLLLRAAIAAACAGALFSPVAARQDNGTKEVVSGRAVYEGACARCHGPDGRAERAPWLIPFQWNYSQTLDIVRRGGPCGMPAFSETDLSDNDVAQIVDYLKAMD